MRQRDLLWWLSDPDPRIVLSKASFHDPLDGTVRVQAAGRHLILIFVAAKDSTFYPTAPLSLEFFATTPGGSGLADLSNPVEPILAQSLTYLGHHETDGGLEPVYSYLYVVPMPAIGISGQSGGHIHYRLANPPMGVTFASSAALGIMGLVEIGPIEGVTFETPALSHTIPEATGGHEDLNGLWLLAGMPAGHRESGDTAVVVWPAPPEGNPLIDDPLSIPGAGDPAFIIGNTGPESGGDLEFEFSEEGTLRGVWIQLLPKLAPDIVDLPVLSTIVTNTFVSAIDEIGGQRRGLPAATATNVFDAAMTPPASGTDWWCVLVDAEGQTVARAPDATIGDLSETLNDITTCKVTVPYNTAAGSAIDDTDQLPAVEVQVWRGNVLWLWGPITAENPKDDASVTVTVSDAPWHLTQRHVGEPGGRFGGRPPYNHDTPANLRFERGDLTGWSIFRTVSIGEFVGFGTPDLDAIHLTPETHLPSGEPMAVCVSPLDPLDNYQLYQDLRISGPQNDRPLNVTLSGWWFIPSAGNFAPNNQRFGLLLATLLDDANLPADYYRPQDWSFTTLDDTAPRDRLFYQECTIELPPGVDTTVHAAVCFPQGVTYIGGLDITVDDGLLYNESPTTIAAGFVIHAQDPAFGRDDVNLDWWANTLGDEQIREYEFNQHTNLFQALTELTREGWFDWHTSYTTSARVMNFTARRRGGYRPGCRIRAVDDGPSNVAVVSRRRTPGATVVAQQTRSREIGNHEHGARTDGLVLEEIGVAPREPADYDLIARAAERLDLTSRPEIIEVDTNPGDERFLYGLSVGDTTDILSTVPGARASGRYRLTARTIDPPADTAHLVFHPEPTP